MKIFAVVRARNEHENIARFCEAYQWADRILVADGGSTDDTIEIASQYPNVTVLHFTEVVTLPEGHTRNPDGRHINFLIKNATDMGADWICMDDCDTIPNYLLQRDARKEIESCQLPFLRVVRLYLYGDNQYFPVLSHKFQSDEWTPGMWAWRANLGMYVDERVIHFDFFVKNKKMNFDVVPTKTLMPPYCLLHKFFTPENVDEKLKYYRESGLVEHMQHPFHFGGKLEGTPVWAHGKQLPVAESD